MSDTNLVLSDAPAIEGLRFRLYRGEEDIPALEAVRREVQAVDGEIWMPGPDTVPNPACDPTRDCLIAEVAGRMVAYTWLTWWEETNGTLLYLHLGWVVPTWQRKGIGRALLHWQEQRLREIASANTGKGIPTFGGNADESQPANRALLLNEGYAVAFTVVKMLCELPAEPVEIAPMPEGLTLRPVEEAHLPAIYAANDSIFQESRHGYSTDSYEEFLADAGWSPETKGLWLVAWDGNQIAGLVISKIEGGEGETPWVAVARDWRRRGVAKALLTLTLRTMQEQSIPRTRLLTVAENPNHSVRLYEGVGYHVTSRHPRYRKLM
ncbi:GNAT family N-acetyltransferase [Ktedonospora formicarum]|uniref:Putative acetyltransferase, GNAT n=1 Tax=Ktedonospora formicarum TaxID=2778364 RepID=A0A8J3I6F9_9CHLR|nr:GNAT family N-acetyltransferase [Ktedonospora formicarum]GHO49521.1 putative acetyltransferase, GNAT [Ktedonospora formicarum]